MEKLLFSLWWSAFLAFGLLTGQANAQSANADTSSFQNCPDYYRFVDLGLSVAGTTPQPGGPVFRVEEDGSPLLHWEASVCLDITGVFTDGHTHPIPVVTEFGIRPERIAAHVTEFLVMRVADHDTLELAQEHVRSHRAARAKASQSVTIGENFLCVARGTESTPATSCEVVNPFDPSFPLAVFCEDGSCRSELIAIDEGIVARAQWSVSDVSSVPATGELVSETIAQIQVFVADKLSR